MRTDLLYLIHDKFQNQSLLEVLDLQRVGILSGGPNL